MTPHTTHFADCGCAAQQFANLLAVIHRDGGHHTGKVGLEQSITDAKAEVTALRAENARLREALQALILHGRNYMKYHAEKFYGNDGANVMGITPALNVAEAALAEGGEK